MQLTLDYLNHASVLVELGPVRLLCDPWYSGTAFAGGWGLRHHNPDALEAAARATHLWISHWHSDHFHLPTLQALQALAPGVQVLANDSANFSMAKRMRALGFENVCELAERRPILIDDAIRLTRYPTAGIDNMLHLEGAGWSVLNYNDCNLRPSALRALQRKLGPIDLLLTNYNHAGKLFEQASPEREKQRLWDALRRVVDILQPRRALPFAGSHYYRSAASRDQNQSLLDFDFLERHALEDERFLILRVGDRAKFASASAEPQRKLREPRLPVLPDELHSYGASATWEALLASAEQRCEQLRLGFPLLDWMLGPLNIHLTDLDRVLQLDLRSGAREVNAEAPHIAVHSRAVQDWLGRPFGDDSFVAGAHFEIRSADLSRIRRWVALSLLHASQLSVRDALRYLGSRDGRWFFWCRREEIMSTLAAGELSAGEIRS